MLSIRRCWVEIDLKRIVENYKICMSRLPEGCKPMAVVKADAYGHGDKEVAAALQAAGCNDFAVSNANEAQNLREAGVTGNILILGYTPVEMAGQLVEDDIMQTLVSEEYAQRLAQTGYPVKCQWAIDTGMNRIGLDADDPEHCEQVIRRYAVGAALDTDESGSVGGAAAAESDSVDGAAMAEGRCEGTDCPESMAAAVHETNNLRILGMFTHLCVADEKSEESLAFTRGQIEKFGRVAAAVRDLKLPFVHCMNSAGGLYHMAQSDYADFNWCRLGIIMYGLKPDYAGSIPEGLRPALEWKSIIDMIKTLHPGETVGYGRTYTCDREMRVATVPAGYADGYLRALSNKGCVLIRGRRAPIVGTICMDQMMVDVTDIPEARVDDEVVLLGRSGDLEYTADDMAHTIGTIGYEIICGISKRTERRYI